MIERRNRLGELLDDALRIAEETGDTDIIARIQRAREAVVDWSSVSSIVRVEVLSGRVSFRGRPVSLSRQELALVVALSLRPAGWSTAELLEFLYPDSDASSALNALRVYVHRVRRRVGVREVIRFSGGGYALGPNVEVDTVRLEEAVAKARFERGRIEGELRETLENALARLAEGRPRFMADWPWFEATAEHLNHLTRDITMLLARDALAGGEYQRTIEFATQLKADDPLDEAARELAIRAFLLAGDRAAAVLELRRYEEITFRELRERPSEELRRLVESYRSA